ncbi:kinesin-like protein KIN-7I [Vigna unguiculata]|nr:kinesin-like protein KIN-7I [Vigna unguiculata]
MTKMRDRASMADAREERGNVALSNAEEERIFVSIRVRPLNERERARHDVSDWECISTNTIKFKNNGHAEQRPLSMDTYTFDRVFGEKCKTKQVYEQGIKDVALSVVRGVNSSIFAYGQTSSGKTHTMTGITEYAVRDIYEYMEKQKDREFVVKFSSMEIYNEAVRDLLNAGSTSLRILDDPEKGTVVEKLTEETLTDRGQLQQLLSICAAERTTEETAMNEASSRSHQIIRLTVESNPRDYVDAARSGALFASVNFVDLAGSERASQTLSAGTRLREGSHINRSLLSLGTVIRKLSKGRNEHVPYRDSKLTRILQNSLGGNARTAIICTISPARSQSEQSRNTLLFAGCAKQVTTNARVNQVKSDKALVKQLQKELARLENELRNYTPNTILLKEKELQIQKMENVIKELTRERDLFQSSAQNKLQSAEKDQPIRVGKDSASGLSGANNFLRRMDSASENLDITTSSLQHTGNSDDDFLLDGNSPTFVGPDPCQGWEEMASRAAAPEDDCKEVPCIEVKEVEIDHKIDAKSSSGNEHCELNPAVVDNTNNLIVDLLKESNGSSTQIDKVDQESSKHPHISNLQQKPATPQLKEPEKVSRTLPTEVERSNSNSSVCYEDKLPKSKLQAIERNSSRERSLSQEMNTSVEDVESLWDSDVEDTASILNFVVGMNEMARQKSLDEDMDDIMVRARTSGTDKRVNRVRGVSFSGTPGPWNFETQLRDTIQLWDACNIPLVHRSYFFLLIKGEISDAVYFDVELRRLSFLKDTFFNATNSTAHGSDVTPNSSLMALNRERKMLSKQVHKKFSWKERNELYVKWGVDLKSKHRSVQLAWCLWTNTKDLNHVRESAALVAKLVGFINSGDASRKIFGLSFLSRWKP